MKERTPYPTADSRPLTAAGRAFVATLMPSLPVEDLRPGCCTPSSVSPWSTAGPAPARPAMPAWSARPREAVPSTSTAMCCWRRSRPALQPWPTGPSADGHPSCHDQQVLCRPRRPRPHPAGQQVEPHATPLLRLDPPGRPPAPHRAPCFEARNPSSTSGFVARIAGASTPRSGRANDGSDLCRLRGRQSTMRSAGSSEGGRVTSAPAALRSTRYHWPSGPE